MTNFGVGNTVPIWIHTLHTTQQISSSSPRRIAYSFGAFFLQLWNEYGVLYFLLVFFFYQFCSHLLKLEMNPVAFVIILLLWMTQKWVRFTYKFYAIWKYTLCTVISKHNYHESDRGRMEIKEKRKERREKKKLERKTILNKTQNLLAFLDNGKPRPLTVQVQMKHHLLFSLWYTHKHTQMHMAVFNSNLCACLAFIHSFWFTIFFPFDCAWILRIHIFTK